MRTAASLITGLSILFSTAPAFAKDTVRLGTLTVAAGFCTPATDGTIGVKLDGITSYAAWLLEYALNHQDEYRRDLLKKHKGNTLLAEQEFAQLKKDAAKFQDIGIRRGQDNLCR